MVTLKAVEKVEILGAMNACILDTINRASITPTGVVVSIGCPLECTNVDGFLEWSKQTMFEAAKYASSKMVAFTDNITSDTYLCQNVTIREDDNISIIKVNRNTVDELSDVSKIVARLKHCITSVPL